MIYYLISLILFVNIVLSLRCKTAWPSNCISNSTCQYNTTECSFRESSRGGTYCTTIIKSSDQIEIGKMDCMYDQETSKICKNQSSCIMKYTNHLKTFLHCCCDQDFCNLNFTLSDPDPLIPPQLDICKGLLCKPIYIILLCLIIGLITLLIIISFIYRKKFFQSFEDCKQYINKSPTTKSSDLPEKDSLLSLNNEQQFDYNNLILGDIIKSGRFSQIHQGFYQNNRVAIKILNYQNKTDESYQLFQREKQIYSLPFINHFNILRYYGCWECNDKLLIITELSEYGSLRDVLRSRLLKDENELILILKQISEGLQYLHKEHQNCNQFQSRPSIGHRDFKSENILYLNSNQLVICDFAMSTKIEQNENGPNQEQQLGTPRYMSPELLAGTIGFEKNALLSCDVYALGIIYWEVLSRYPFKDSDEKYVQPFEKQLIENKSNVTNPTVNDMLRIINLPEPFNRPLINPLWENFDQHWLNQIVKTMKDCWDQNPEGRISSAAVARRMQQLTL